MPVSAREIFETQLPKALELLGPSAKKLGKTYHFQLSGKDGGEWVVNLKQGKVLRGGIEAADLYLEMTAEDFTAMAAGQLDVDLACQSGQIRLEGNPRFLAMLGNLLVH